MGSLYTRKQAIRFKKAHDAYAKKTDRFDTAHITGDIPGVHAKERDKAYDAWYTDQEKKQQQARKQKKAEWKKTATRWQRIKAALSPTHPALRESLIEAIIEALAEEESLFRNRPKY